MLHNKPPAASHRPVSRSTGFIAPTPYMTFRHKEAFKSVAEYISKKAGLRVIWKHGSRDASISSDGVMVLPDTTAFHDLNVLATLIHECQHLLSSDFKIVCEASKTPHLQPITNMVEDMRVDRLAQPRWPAYKELIQETRQMDETDGVKEYLELVKAGKAPPIEEHPEWFNKIHKVYVETAEIESAVSFSEETERWWSENRAAIQDKLENIESCQDAFDISKWLYDLADVEVLDPPEQEPSDGKGQSGDGPPPPGGNAPRGWEDKVQRFKDWIDDGGAGRPGDWLRQVDGEGTNIDESDLPGKKPGVGGIASTEAKRIDLPMDTHTEDLLREIVMDITLDDERVDSGRIDKRKLHEFSYGSIPFKEERLSNEEPKAQVIFCVDRSGSMNKAAIDEDWKGREDKKSISYLNRSYVEIDTIHDIAVSITNEMLRVFTELNSEFGNMLKLGVVVFSNYTEVIRNFGNPVDKYIDWHSGGGTYMKPAIEKAYEMFDKQGSEPHDKRILMILSDGCVNNSDIEFLNNHARADVTHVLVGLWGETDQDYWRQEVYFGATMIRLPSPFGHVIKHRNCVWSSISSILQDALTERN